MIDPRLFPPIEDTAPIVAKVHRDRSSLRRLFRLAFPYAHLITRKELVRRARAMRIGKIIPLPGDKK